MSITVAQILGYRSVERGGDSRQKSCTSIEQGVRIVLYAVPAFHGTAGTPTGYTYVVPGTAFRLRWDG